MKRLFPCLLFLQVLFAACNKSEPTPTPEITEDEIIQIPVVVHVIYDLEIFNISDEKIASQVAVLNHDFRKRNPDHLNTPQEFLPLVADVGIEFKLASTDPNGQPTNGITRTQSKVDGFQGHDPGLPVEALKLYFTEQGGHDAWPTDQYLNIWVAEMTDRHGNLGLAGYAQAPGADPRIDGVVIDPRAFGTLPPLAEGNGLGRTATHEIGHWLNLLHTYGNPQEACQSTDFVEDTPTTTGPHHGSPSYPQYSCGKSSMFMNFMDLVDDEAMYMFTQGQRTRMRAVFARKGKRYRMYQNISRY
ncbi:zinc metalloprotease [Cesiribacter sp. SM1]|uniref:zinc metalloprotease n=1 Tax=Cesiribacter sp. SM1 TaxID=2861196 RepID=UPI001CD1FD25|nr:zinc metalloprotease [Cesiribacter sp. SM1]